MVSIGSSIMMLSSLMIKSSVDFGNQADKNDPGRFAANAVTENQRQSAKTSAAEWEIKNNSKATSDIYAAVVRYMA